MILSNDISLSKNNKDKLEEHNKNKKYPNEVKQKGLKIQKKKKNNLMFDIIFKTLYKKFHK